MSRWNHILKKLCYPHLAIVVILSAISIWGLVYSFFVQGAIAILQYLSYFISAYTLTVICFRMPNIIHFFKVFKKENEYLQKWSADIHWRMNVSLYVSFVWNMSFAIFQLVLGLYHKSFWFYSMFIYYTMLGIMRLLLVKHTRKYKANEKFKSETIKYILCGWLLLVMNLALLVIVFFMVYFNRTFYHDMITAIVMATYTFLTFTFAIIGLVKYKKYKSPVYSSAKVIALIAGAVSILTLERTMLTTFGTGESLLFNQLMLSLTGVAVISFNIIMANLMIIKGNKQLRIIKLDSHLSYKKKN